MNSHAIHRQALGSRTFWRHFAEMVVAMYVGMALGGLISGLVLGAFDLSLREVRLDYPEAFMLYMATVMTVPMVAWMRHRGHSWRLSWEMTAAMVIPGFALLCLYWMDVTTGPACSLYCALMVPAMLLVMLFRRDEYGGHATHAS
jgi:hypothetical protein